MRILLVRLSAIGDCLFCTPVVEALRNSFPDAHIGWVVHPHCAPVISGNPFIDVVHQLPRHRLLNRLPGISRELRAQRYDIAVDMQGLFKSALVARFSGARRRLGPDRSLERTQLLYTERIPFDEQVHIIPRYLGFATAIGAKWDTEPKMLMPFGDKERDHVRNLMTELGLSPSQPLVAINPATSRPIKDWPPSKFAELADKLKARYGVVIALTGSPADQALCDHIMSLMKTSAVNVAGRTSLNELAAFLSFTRLFVGGDTGPVHIAQAAGTRVLAIFGPTDPKVLGPRGSEHDVAYLNLDCSPCRHKVCPIGHPCLLQMSVDMVAEKAGYMLA